jgi:hypothetical protein
MRHAVYTLVLAFSAVLALPAAANEISTDITVNLGGTLTDDEDAVEDAAGSVTQIDLGALPAAADLIGYSIATNGDVLFSLDIAASLPGGIDTTPRDVVRWNGSTYSIEFDGADHSIPAGAQVDAIGVVAGDLLLSFDVTVALGNVTAADEDLVRLESTVPDVWSLYFDGSTAGVPAGADLDGADLLDQSGNLALSFDISGSVGGVTFDDEDILEYVEAGGTWSKRYDGSTAHAALAAADVDAVFVPEPMALGAGAAALFGLLMATRRRRAGPLLVLAGLASTLASPAFAADGRVEINQAAVTAGSGFPYQITQPGSYMLTSDLVVPDANTSAIQISASTGVTLDLNGFTVRGPVTCSHSGDEFYDASLLTCSASGNGTGISGGSGAWIRNGHVRGFGRYGIQASGSLSSHSVVEDVRVEQNAQGGIYLNNGTVRRVNVARNGADGIFNIAAGDASSATVIEDSNIAFNKGDGIGLASKVRNCRISYNGGAGLIHTNAGGQNSSVTDSQIYRNNGKAINGYGSYRDSEITGNDSTGGQVIGGMSDEGGNNVH